MRMLARRRDTAAQVATMPRIQLRCPRCGFGLGPLTNEEFSSPRVLCPTCLLEIPCRDGIWRAILPGREAYFERFIMECQIVRSMERHGSNSDASYLQLPYGNLSGANGAQWRIRARTYRYIERKLLPRLDKRHCGALDILDVGAGNGWLSYRLTLCGHRTVAVDLLTDEWDGLGAAVHYESVLKKLFPRFQAEMDHLPFVDSQFDAVIFNAAFHYSEDYERTLAEAVRCVRNEGLIIIADSPCYRSEVSGVEMVIERQALFTRNFGFPSDALASQEYLTGRRMIALEDRLGLRWQVHSPWYGVRWALRPFVAAVRGKREPYRFRIYMAEVRK